MPDGSSPRKIQRLPSRTRLDSWKEIAAYLGREVRTVQRWEKNDGLPVHRLFHSKRGSVYATPEELDRWLESRRISGLDTDFDIPMVGSADETVEDEVAEEAGLGDPEFDRATSKWTRALPLAGGLLIAGMVAGWLLRSSVVNPPAQVVSITNFPGDEDNPAISWDGTRAAFSWNGVDGQNYDIYVSALDRGGVKRLTTAAEWDFSPSWSPKEDQIAFLRAKGSSVAEVIVASPDGGAERKIGEVKTAIAGLELKRIGLAWTPDSKYLVVAGTDSDQAEGLLLMPLAGGASRRLTLPPAGQYDTDPALSADAKTLVFRRQLTYFVAELFVVELGANYLPTGPERPLHNKPDVQVASPTWESPNSLLYIAKGRVMRAAIVAGDLSRAEPRDVTPVSDCGLVAISAKPSRPGIVLGSCQHNTPYAWRLDLGQASNGGLKMTKLLPAEACALSPDNKRFAFEAYVEGLSKIWVANIDGTSSHVITSWKGAMGGSPAWSPDGTQIAYDSSVEGHGNIYLAGVDGSHPRRLTEGRADYVLPNWSRDGKWIYLATNGSGTFQVARMPAGGGEITQITHGGGTSSQESVDGTYVYYTHRTADAWSLRRCNRDGGNDSEVVSRIMNRAFAVGRDRIYFIPPPDGDGRSAVRCLDLRTGETNTVTPIQKPIQRPVVLSADGQFLLFSQYDQWGRDLVVVRNLR
jgi:Tol biopolymer transport system component